MVASVPEITIMCLFFFIFIILMYVVMSPVNTYIFKWLDCDDLYNYIYPNCAKIPHPRKYFVIILLIISIIFIGLNVCVTNMNSVSAREQKEQNEKRFKKAIEKDQKYHNMIYRKNSDD